jgi:hypothetical protein
LIAWIAIGEAIDVALTALGVTAFSQIGPAKWHTDAWELDRLVIPYDGYITGLEAFLSSNPQWSSSSVDGNMLLSNRTVSEDKRYPKVDLIYLGKRNGILPPARNGSGYTIQQVRFTSFDFKDTDGLWINLTYIAPTSSKTVWSRTPVDIGTIGAIAPANVTGVWFTAEKVGSSHTVPTNIGAAMGYFSQRLSTTGDSEEMVPGQYYRGTQTKQNLLFSNEF